MKTATLCTEFLQDPGQGQLWPKFSASKQWLDINWVACSSMQEMETYQIRNMVVYFLMSAFPLKYTNISFLINRKQKNMVRLGAKGIGFSFYCVSQWRGFALSLWLLLRPWSLWQGLCSVTLVIVKTLVTVARALLCPFGYFETMVTE